MVEYSVSARLLEGAGQHDDRSCSIEWSGEFTAEPDAAPDDIVAGLENAYRGMSELLNELLTAAD
jgi:hypothetical protein